MSENVVEKLHHLFGGSTAKYWANCHGWAALTSQLPKEEAGPAAARGTALHTGVLERYTAAWIAHLTNGTPVNVSYDDIPDWPADEGPEIAGAFWMSFFQEVLEGIITGKQIYIEKKLMFSEAGDAGGTADVIVLHYNDKAQLVAWVGDLKTGYHRVEPDEEQLLFYLAALYLRVKEKGKEIDVFRSFIYQPTHSQAFSAHTFSKNQVLKAVKKYEKAIAEARKEKPKFKAGDWCKFCRAQACCKAYAKQLEKTMDLAVVDNKLPPVETLPDEVLVTLWTYEDKFKAYFKAVKKRIIERFVANQPIKGLKVVEGVSKRRWLADEEAVIGVLRAKYGIEPTKQVMMGLGDVKNLLKEKGLKPKMADEAIAPLTEKPRGQPKVTTEDDPAPPMQLDSGTNLLEEAEYVE